MTNSYFPDLTDKQRQQLADAESLYKDWNQKINVISRKDMDSFQERHLLHSLAIAKFVQFADGAKVLDVGTGGGFPGIPLAILFPQAEFYLVDSIGKKIKVVNAIAEELGLQNVRADHLRAENVKGQFDFIVSRAVTRLNNFLPWVKNKVQAGFESSLPNGMLFLKGGDLEEEISEVKADIEVFELSRIYEEEFFETKKVLYIPRNQ